MFLQSPSGPGHYFGSINISSTLSSSITIETLSSTLPFASDNSQAFVPSISSDGELSVYAGSCSTANHASLWTFAPENGNAKGNGTWTKETTTTAGSFTAADLSGANFLSQSFSFSTLVQANVSQTDIFIFGGMCPNSTATASTGQSAASYSNHMLRLTPGPSDYALDFTASGRPPIPEAGFTITGLTPTYSNGSGVETQQQSFVLLGGHTQTAFINMSQVAIWSMPEESWNFVTVNSPLASNPNTELAIKSMATGVDSRSGHTAILSADGSKVIVFGGWVGDTSQAADPQLAVLELGTGFGGSGDWIWSIPSEQPSGTGVYGHGAVMLPGNIMMILGGYNISDSTTSKRDVTTSVQPMFLNATSLSWISNYTNPAYVAAVADSAAQASSSAESKKKLGLGIGLGVGLAIALIVLGICLWYPRRRRSSEVEEREKHIKTLSARTCNYYAPNGEMRQADGRYPWESPYSDPNTGAYGSAGSAFPSLGSQIIRKPVNARGLYQPTPPSDMGSVSARPNPLGTAGPIHPIYEADEEDPASRISDIGVGMAFGDPPAGPVPSNISNRYSDPFRDPQPPNFSAPLRQSRDMTPDPESPTRSREREVQQWVSDWAGADALLDSQARSHSSMGRVSPSRRARLSAGQMIASSVSAEEEYDRAGSSLSDHSIAISNMTVSRSDSSSQGHPRTNSLRGFIANAVNPVGLLSAFDSRQPPRSAGSGASSFATAHTSFHALQVEGEGLLARPVEEVYVYSGENSPTHPPDSVPGSPSKSKAPAFGKRNTWLGSLRRAIVGDSSSENNTRTLISGARTPSPTRIGQPSDATPRRAVSASATLLRRKQGRGDWEDSEDLETRSRGTARNSALAGDLASGASSVGDYGDEDEWDIERAVQNRVVQVMFTVPKEKLRVVNHDVATEGSDGGSLRSKVSNRSLETPDATMETVALVQDAEGREVDNDSQTKGKAKGRVKEIVEKIERSSDDGI